MIDLKNEKVTRNSDKQIGVIKDVSDLDIDAKDIIITVEFKDGVKMYSLSKAVTSGNISIDNSDKIIESISKAVDLEQKKQEEKTKIMLELAKQDSMRAFMLAKGNKREKTFIKQITTKPTLDVDFIDWLKDNTQSIVANIPDYLEPAFNRYFGTDSPRTVVSTLIKTPGGYDRKYSFSFTLHVSKNVEIPNQFKHYFKEDNCLNNTSFISDLIMSHGFKFGKNLDKVID